MVLVLGSDGRVIHYTWIGNYFVITVWRSFVNFHAFFPPFTLGAEKSLKGKGGKISYMREIAYLLLLKKIQFAFCFRTVSNSKFFLKNRYHNRRCRIRRGWHKIWRRKTIFQDISFKKFKLRWWCRRTRMILTGEQIWKKDETQVTWGI